MIGKYQYETSWGEETFRRKDLTAYLSDSIQVVIKLYRSFCCRCTMVNRVTVL